MQRTAACRTHPDHLPKEEDIRQVEQPYFLLAAYDDDLLDTLGMVFLQRLSLPMVVDSEKGQAGR